MNLSFKPGTILRIKPKQMVALSAREEFRNCLLFEISNRFKEMNGGSWCETNHPYFQLLLGDGTHRSINTKEFGDYFEVVIAAEEKEEDDER